MKKIFSFFIALFLCIQIFAVTEKKPDYVHNYERILDDAEICFSESSFGDALNYAEKAKNARKYQYEWEIKLLENSFKPNDVKKKGDSLSDIRKLMVEREDFDAVEIIDRYTLKLGFDYFDNSKKKLLLFLEENKIYPEAEFLIGRIYCLEGEYDIAWRYYSKALENSNLLDVPSFKYDILYELAKVSQLLNKSDKYEEYLLLILSQSEEFKNESLSQAMLNTLSGTKSNCLEKFFSLYRCENHKVIKAYFDLTDYYVEHNRKEKALKTCSLGVIASYSKIIDVIKKRDAEFSGENLVDVLKEVQNYDDIVKWGIENDIWKGFYNLAEITYKNNDLIFCIQLFNILKDLEPEQYWKDKASVRLKEITG